MVNNNTPVLPPNFRYRHVLEKGKPVHDRSDRFFAKHPPMELAKRAKIFSPFDALKGFSSAVSAKNELYESRRDLNEEDLQELERRYVEEKPVVKEEKTEQQRAFAAQKTFSKEQRKLQNRVSWLEKEITKRESRMAEIGRHGTFTKERPASTSNASVTWIPLRKNGRN